MIDRALNLHEDGRIVEVDTSPLPEFELGALPAPMLFDIALDPFELNDVASVHPERVTTMTSELEHWFENVEQDRLHSLLSSG
jgi:hypothetical protein